MVRRSLRLTACDYARMQVSLVRLTTTSRVDTVANRLVWECVTRLVICLFICFGEGGQPIVWPAPHTKRAYRVVYLTTVPFLAAGVLRGGGGGGAIYFVIGSK